MFSIEFFLTSLVVVIVPGTGVIYTVSTALSGSRRQSIIAAIGCTLGIVPHLMAGILGISAILHLSATIFQFVKIIGVIYLIYLGFNLIKNSNMIDFTDEKAIDKDLKIIGKGILLNVLNPKLTLFFLSFLPQFLTESNNSFSSQMIFLSLVFMGMTVVIFILYGLLANSFKMIIQSSNKLTKRIQQGFGIILMGFAAKLAISDN